MTGLYRQGRQFIGNRASDMMDRRAQNGQGRSLASNDFSRNGHGDDPDEDGML